ncbi:MAG: hypothetical protein JRN44_00305 [Nitrososphaerota archaeon]|jgi:hemerythrin-like domain-containing protein|nr:hypothetical protein [Nitrososphaerota archaeon]MDG6941879.1 hypothetical protein [Nitrososphaerota archaeon]MDG6946948.1 hypothetical protein [Nitrososphaerota archaeon]MDG6950641.1 hypothetical protein [Nitrososphaerota archaeon]
MEGEGGAAFRPREMGVGALVRKLAEEHALMSDALERAKEASKRGDISAVSRELQAIDPVFRQHIADEEAQILGLLVRELGRQGAAEAIRVFQQHQPMYRLMLKVKELASKPSEELREGGDSLAELFEAHARAEETRVFPVAAALGGAERSS